MYVRRQYPDVTKISADQDLTQTTHSIRKCFQSDTSPCCTPPSRGFGQGCQIFLGATYQNGKNVPKWPQNIPNGCKIDEMSIKFTNIFYCKTLQNLPKLEFLVWKYTIWQPRFRIHPVIFSPSSESFWAKHFDQFFLLFCAWRYNICGKFEISVSTGYIPFQDTCFPTWKVGSFS
jgi:hypothetical protein